ncbi:MAG: cation transporter [Acidobacteria bacterium]|nr:cation transporter [Acidobacteriota bacterium]
MFHQRTAAMVASVTALVLVTLKLGVGFATGTLSLLASAADSAFDLIISLFNYLVLKTSDKPSDEDYNYGRGKLEALASIVEGLIIFASALVIMVSAIKRLIVATPLQQVDIATWTMGFSLAATVFLVLYLNHVAKLTKNMVIEADVLHYKADLLSNSGILIALVAVQYTGWTSIDAIVSIGVAGYLVYATIPLIRKGFHMIMDRALSPDIVQTIREIMESEPGLNSFHELRTRQSAGIHFVDVHLVFTRTISLLDAHTIADRIAAKIREISNCRWMINMHMDPTDDSKKESNLTKI